MTNLLLAVIYLAFISLGLPDSLLGAAWPSMGPQLHVPLSWAGGVSMTISAGTIVSSLLSDRLTLRIGAGKLTAISVGVTALALFGFSLAPNYWILLLIAVPYGLGAGGVDAALNNYVAVHYASRHMSWLHCMWGIGASVGPYIMGFALSKQHSWELGYRIIAVLQILLTVILVFSLPLWKSRKDEASKGASTSGGGAVVDGSGGHAAQEERSKRKPLTLRQVFALRGAVEIMVMFFCYCAVESTAGLWASSYMVLHSHIDKTLAASLASLFYLGITGGRALSGFMTMRFDDSTMIRIGQIVLACGVVLLLLPIPGKAAVITGLVLVGLGCAPIYPCVIHSTPAYFGADKSQAIVGVQMACAYTGSMLMPPVFGLIADHISIAWYPVFLGVLLVVMAVMHERLRRVVKH
ncbi:MFS transporter [Bifidobacterium bombi]|uniref:MFS family major facilitator transporter n=1 Tax=Bifidobacterium bombi DSM 19703 TaxID=1341695 RepID=A0A080N2J2_9BIFI|nr:MFS transporter [Bifidobacterium bombi]KFF31202.1 MFS family major facilitator transporter [Bifidobacterium bombi DSM 19703]